MPARLKTFLSGEQTWWFVRAVGFSDLSWPPAACQPLSSRTTSLQCCIIDPAAADCAPPGMAVSRVGISQCWGGGCWRGTAAMLLAAGCGDEATAPLETNGQGDVGPRVDGGMKITQLLPTTMTL